MTNDNRKRAIRAYMAAHGVNYTTAQRALDAQRTNLTLVSEAVERFHSCHPDYESPDSLWETISHLAEDSHGNDKWATWAAERYRALQDSIVHEEGRRIPALIDTLHARFADHIVGFDRSTITGHMKESLDLGFEGYWDEARYDDGYTAHATIDMTAGLISWLDPDNGPDAPEKKALFQRTQRLRIALLDTLDREPTTDELAQLLHVTPKELVALTAHRPEHTRPIAFVIADIAVEELGRVTEGVHPTEEELAGTKDWHIVHRTALELTGSQRVVYLFGNIAGFPNETLATILGLDEDEIVTLAENADATEKVKRIQRLAGTPGSR